MLKRWLLRFLVLAILVAGAVWTFHFVHHLLAYEVTDDAYLAGHLHLVSSRLAGNVSEVLVKENQPVRAGQPLARLDAGPFRLARDKAAASLNETKAEWQQAQAALAQTKAGATEAQAQVALAEAQVKETQAQLDVAKVNFGRNQRLFQGDVRAVSKSEVDTTKSTADAGQAALAGAQARVEAARAKASAEEASVKAGEANVAAAEASVATQEAALRESELDLSYTEITSPADGRIGNKNVESGNRVSAGQALFAVVGKEIWVQANFKETQLRHMTPGQVVEMTIDAISGRDFTGKVESVSPATGAQFALLPPDNATGNFTKVVQRIPVKIVFDPQSIRGVEDRLQPGLSTVVNVRLK